MLAFVSWFNPWLENGQVFNKFKPPNIRIKMIFIRLLLKKNLSFIIDYTQVFDADPEIFSHSKQV